MSSPHLPAVSENDQTLDLGALVGILRRNRRLILLCSVAVLGAVAAFTFSVTPQYASSISIRIEEPRSQLPALDALLSFSAAREVATEMEVLGSRTLAGYVVDSLSLNVELASPRRFASALGCGGLAPPEGTIQGRIVSLWTQTTRPLFQRPEVPRSQLLSSVRVSEPTAVGTWVLTRTEEGFSVRDPQGGLHRPVRSGQSITLPGLRFTLEDSASGHDVLCLHLDDREDAIDGFLKSARVSRPSREANIVTVRYRAADPVLTHEALNLLAAQFIQRRQQLQKSDVNSTVAFLNEQIEALREQLFAAEYRLRTFREAEQVVDLEMEAGAGVSRLSALQAERSGLDAERTALEVLIAQVEAAAAAPGDPPRSAYRRLLAFPTLLRNPAAAEHLRALAFLEDQRTELLRTRSPDYPDLQVIEARIAEQEGHVRDLATTYLESLTNQVRAIDASLARFQQDLGRVPAREARHARLQRDFSVLEDLYSLLQARLREAEIAQAAQDQSVRVVDFATPQRKPVFPRTRLNLAAGALVGILLGLTLALGREYRDTSLRTRSSVQRATGLPVLGLIPRMAIRSGRRFLPGGAPGGRAGALVPFAVAPSGAQARDSLESPDGEIAFEAYTRLRTNIRFAREKGEDGTLLVTSPLPEEGKTTTAVNLALTFALQGRATLLVDADLRRGRIGALVGHDPSPGLSDLITGAALPAQAIRPIQLRNGNTLDCLPAGTPLAEVATLVGSDEVGRLLSTLAHRYDIVVIDTPPVNVLADAALLAVHADAVILVAQVGVTHPHALAFAVEQLSGSAADIIGVVLNDIDLRRDLVYDDAYRWQREGYQYTS